MPEFIETIVVGGGQAGLAASYFLKQSACAHLVFERASRPASAWRAGRRWDSFTLVTPNWTLRMPGAEYAGKHPDGFLARDEVVSYFEDYERRFQLPVNHGLEVTSVERTAKSRYLLRSDSGEFEAANVVIAIGLYQRARIPGFASQFPGGVVQMHSSEYRRPSALPKGAVLVVGAGQSGTQIAEELYQSGRRVFLSVGRTVRVPRRYRGQDTYRWAESLGLTNTPVEQLKTPHEKFGINPTISGKDGGRTLNLHQFARDGVVLTGRLKTIEDGALHFESNRMEELAEADEFEAKAVQAIDQYIARSGLEIPSEPLPQLRDGYEAAEISRLEIGKAGITSVIWASGYTFDFNLIRLPICERDGYPRHKRGVTEFPGLYFLGLPWLHTRKSGLILGAGEDASHVVSHLLDSQKTRAATMKNLQTTKISAD